MASNLARTVLGDIPADRLGVTMVHEHLVLPTRQMWPWVQGADGQLTQDGPTFLAGSLANYRQHGGGTLVDVSASHHKPDPRMWRAISEQTGVHIIASTGFTKEPMYPPWVEQWGIDEFEQFFVKEISEGLGDSDVKAGIISEVGSFRNLIRPREEKVLRAAARAAKRTGVPISTHCTLGTMPLAQLDLFEQEGMDLGRVAIGHQDLHSNLEVHEAIMQRGAFVQFDTIGKERYDYVIQENRGLGEVEYISERHYRKDADRLACLVELVKRGHAKQLMLSQDMSDSESFFSPDTHGKWGYAFLLGSFVPRLRAAGVPEEAIQVMLVDNPSKFFSLGG